MSETGTERCHGCSDLLTEENRGPDPLFCSGCVPHRKSDLKPGGLNMTIFEATMIAEGVDEADQETQIEAWQMLIDTGVCWSLQGFFGRTAQALIEQGVCNA